jgi:dTDP-4-amino-4,6-dideoxygalactose transaminase
MKIQMVDLKGQYDKIANEINAGIQDVIANTQFIKGPQIKQFEDALALELGVKHVIACANGTDALQIAMMALGLKPGDEVILPVFTYVATAEVIALLGLTPVMVDVDADTFCIDVNLIETKISVRTKAIVPVHLFGQCANMDAIMEIADRHNLFVIEDTAQAIGASVRQAQDDAEVQLPEASGQKLDASSQSAGLPTYAKASAGAIGHIGTTSFFPSKNLGCFGDGGGMVTNDDELAKKIRMICNHGQSVQYVHDVIGVNSRLDSIQSAVLNAKLPHLREYEAARNRAADWYDELLGNHPNIVIPKRNPKSTHVFHQYTIRVKSEELRIKSENLGGKSEELRIKSDVALNSSLLILHSKRDAIRKSLSDKGIPTMVYYPIELHKQKAFAQYWDGVERFPVAEELVQTVLSLPMHTEMTREMVEYVCAALIEITNRVTNP